MNANLTLSAQQQATFLLVGRILMALIFVWFGYLKLTNWGGTIQYFTKWGFAWAPTLGAVPEFVQALQPFGCAAGRFACTPFGIPRNIA